MAKITIPKFKVSLPAIFAIFGGNSVVQRVLHVPDAKVNSAVARANVILVDKGFPSLTVAQWRAVEQVQQEIVTDGIPDLTL